MAGVGVVDGQFPALHFGIGGHEPVAAQTVEQVQGVEQFGEQPRRLADLRKAAPFGAGGVQPAPVVNRLDVEGAVAAEVGEQVESDAEVVRPPGLFFEVEQQAFAFGGAQQAKVRAGVVAAGGQLPRVSFGLAFVEDFAGHRFELIGQALRAGEFGALEADESDANVLDGWRAVQGLPLPIGRRVHGERGQPLELRLNTSLAAIDQFAGLVEIACGQRAQIGRDEHIGRLEQGQAALHVLLGQDADHLPGETAHRGQRLA